MDDEIVSHIQKKQVEKLNRITKRIQKTRKNIKIAQKEAAEFKEIQNLLHSNISDDELQTITETEPEKLNQLGCSVIPATLPGVKVFHDELIFSLFQEHDCSLKNFIKKEEEYAIFSNNIATLTEETVRKLISYRIAENLLLEEGKYSVSLYVFYLISVHEDPSFVSSCFDFLKHHTFPIQVEDIKLIFNNFGAKWEDLFDFCEETFLEKFPGKNASSKGASTATFPFFNLEMVGRILLQYISEDSLVIDANIKSFVRGLIRITLDPKVHSGLLLPLYSTILTSLCSKAQKDFGLEEVLGWVYFKEEHLLNQLEISQNILKPICADLHDRLVLKILSELLQSRLLPAKLPFKIIHVKAALKKAKDRDLPPLELYSLLQLINASLPGLTATVKHSDEINSLLACLELKINKVEDSVDLMRLKLEIAKVGNLVTNNVNNRFAIQEKAKKLSSKKVKCSN